MKQLAWAGLIAMAGIGLANAQDAGPPPGGGMRMSAEDRFKQLDKNGDGKLSLAEFQAAPAGRPGGPTMTPEEQAARFKKLDTNNDGFLSLDEYKAGRGGPGGGGQPPPAN